jgi:peptide/nickel transport system substrate-binding protein
MRSTPKVLTTKSKSTVYYLPELWDTTWHDGSKMSVADFVWTMIITFDGGKPESKIYDESLASGVETYLTHFKGVRIVSTDPLIIETYDDQYAMDAELSITDWFPSRYNPATSTNGMMSWHGMTPAVMGEANGELAFSTDKAGANEIDWTSFIAGPSLEIQVKYLDQAIAEQYIPYAPTMSEYLTADEAARATTTSRASTPRTSTSSSAPAPTWLNRSTRWKAPSPWRTTPITSSPPTCGPALASRNW